MNVYAEDRIWIIKYQKVNSQYSNNIFLRTHCTVQFNFKMIK